MFFRSLFYERNVLMHLERVQQLSAEVQAEIAKRVGNFIEVARSASDLLQRFAQAAREEKERAVELGTKSDMDPLWAAPAISEAWCKAKLGLATGSLDANSAIEIIVAIEKFTARQRKANPSSIASVKRNNEKGSMPPELIEKTRGLGKLLSMPRHVK